MVFRIFVLATALSVLSPATALGASCPGGLTRDLEEGVVLPGRIEAIARGMAELGVESCGATLINLARSEVSSRTPSAVGRIAELWGDPELLPLLYSAYAHGMLRPYERSNDLALAMADAIASVRNKAALTGDLLAPLRDQTLAQDWLAQAAQRLRTEWAPALEAKELTLPEDSEQLDQQRMELLFNCLDEPASVPEDTFDPLGLAQGPGAELSLGTRCSTMAVLDSWRSASSEFERERLDNLVQQYTPMGDFLPLAGKLERSWRQGRSTWAAGVPARSTWQSPDHGAPATSLGPMQAVAAVILLVGLLLLALVRRDGRKQNLLRLSALVFGVVLLCAAEAALSLTGRPPGDEGRPTARLSLSVDPPPGRPGVLLDQAGRAVRIPKPPQMVRLGIAGASSVAGVNLAHRDTFNARLEALLKDELPCVQVLNFGQPGISLRDVRGTAIAAADAFGLDGVILYSGHNEVGAARERGPHRSLRGRMVKVEAAMTRTRMAGLLRSVLPKPDPNAPEQGGGASESDENMNRYLPAFEQAVNDHYKRELVDLARAMQRRSLPLVLAMPSFNHHGLRLSTVPDLPEIPLRKDGTTPANHIVALLEEGSYAEALNAANALAQQLPDHGAPRLLASFAHEAQGNLQAAEAEIWEAARRNQVGSALTPGLAAVLLEVAARFQLPVSDVHAALHEASPGHLPGFDLFVDFVHLSPQGSQIVAQEMAKTLKESGLLDGWRGRCSPAQEAPNPTP